MADGYRFEIVEGPGTEIASYRSGASVEAVPGHLYRDTIYDELVIDPAPMLRALVTDIRARVAVPVMAARFHSGVAETIAEVCSRMRSLGAPPLVGLTGGVFQNVRLLGEAKGRLERDGFRVLTHRVVPPNDGGLALGQAVVGAGF